MTKHDKTVEQTYRLLSEIEHVKLRAGRYLGSISPVTQDGYLLDGNKFTKKEYTAIPAMVKIFSEILDNSVDEYKRAPDVLSKIKVSISKLTGEICIEDDGRGIPVVIHEDTKQYVPEMIFSNLRAGSNFNDDDGEWAGSGTNGEGSTLVAIMSDYFIVETADSKNSFRQEYNKGLTEKSNPVVHKSTRHYTRITFCPDYEYFKMEGMTNDYYNRLVKCVYDSAANNPKIEYVLNGKVIKIDTFEDYIKMYSDNYVFEESNDWKIAVTPSDGFEHISFVNGIDTFVGGTHVDYIANQIVNKLRDHIQKKHKVDVKPSDIKTHFRLFISCNINRPRFSSQTKENMTSPVSDYKTSHTVSDKFIKKVVGSEVVQSILDLVMAKQAAEEAKELRNKNKNVDSKTLKKIPKFHDASSKNRAETILWIAEGDSAQRPILDSRDGTIHGVFPVRGRPINVSAFTMAKVRANVELEYIRQIIGLKYGQKANVDELNFGKIAIASDADNYGHSIAGLLINMFYRLWPEIIEAGMLYRLVTPVVVASGKGFTKEFYSLEEFDTWCNENKDTKFSYKYLKGLGSTHADMFGKYLSNPEKYMVQFTMQDKEDIELLDLCFSKEKGSSDKRKEWLNLED